MVRQRSLTVRPWTEFLQHCWVDGASVAIVGNAGYLKDLDQGRQIDGFDLVIRMNNFRLAGFRRQVGSRTDIVMTNFSVGAIQLDDPAVRRARYLVSSSPNNFFRRRRLGICSRMGRDMTITLTVSLARHACPRLGGVKPSPP
jgi:hypothetical protein